MDRPNRKRVGLFSRGIILRCAVLAAATSLALAACESPMQSDTFEKNWGTYSNSILTRAVMDGTLTSVPMNGPTQNQGVQESTRVDSTGNNSSETDSAGAVIPAGSPSPNLPTADAVGRAAAMEADDPSAANLGQNEPIVRLSLEDALARALNHSLAIKVEAYNSGIKEAQITEAMAAFDPVFFAQSQYTNQDEPTALVVDTNGVTWANNAGIRQLLPSGGTVQAGVGDTYRDLQNKAIITPNASHEPDINLSISQPLLRGFGADVNRANIYLAQRDRRIALTQFRRQVIQSCADVEEAYHNLVLARSAVEIQEDLLTETSDTYKRILARREVDADKVQIKQAEAAVQSRRAELIRALASVRDASDRLKSFINDPQLDLASGLMIVPTDRPVDVPIAFNVADQIDIALKQRTELQEARLQIQRADIVVEVSRNDLLPRADLTLSTQSNGYDNGLDQAFTSTFDSPKFIDYAAGLKIEIPIGNRQFEAVYHRRQLERRQAVTQMLRIAQQVILDVKTQLRAVLSSYRETQARRAATISAREQLVAISQKELVEKLTPEFLNLKLQAQQDLANAALNELQALINYNLAMMRLEQAKGTLLEYNRIAIDRAPEVRHDKGKVRFLGETYDWWHPADD